MRASSTAGYFRPARDPPLLFPWPAPPSLLLPGPSDSRELRGDARGGSSREISSVGRNREPVSEVSVEKSGLASSVGFYRGSFGPLGLSPTGFGFICLFFFRPGFSRALEKLLGAFRFNPDNKTKGAQFAFRRGFVPLGVCFRSVNHRGDGAKAKLAFSGCHKAWSFDLADGNVDSFNRRGVGTSVKRST